MEDDARMQTLESLSERRRRRLLQALATDGVAVAEVTAGIRTDPQLLHKVIATARQSLGGRGGTLRLEQAVMVLGMQRVSDIVRERLTQI